MSFTFHTGPYPTVGVPNTVTTGHDGADGSIKTGAGKLILSSSANVIHVSASLDLGLVPESSYHIRAVNADLVLSSSAGSYVYISGNLTAEQDFLVKGDSVLSGNVVVGGQIYDLNSNLILSSSVGYVIAASGSLDFPQTDKTYHIRAVNSHLILSSSVGSKIVFSSSINLLQNDLSGAGDIVAGNAGGPIIKNVAADKLVPTLIPDRSDPDTGIGRAGANDIVFIAGGQDGIGILSASATGITARISGSLDFIQLDNNNKAYHLCSVNSHLILSSTVGSIIALSSNLYFPVDAPSDDAHITANNSHLILSSSAGSAITFSGSTFNFGKLGPAGVELILGGTNGATLRIGQNFTQVTAGGSTTLTNTGNGALVLLENSTGGGGVLHRANYHRINSRDSNTNYVFVTSSLDIATVLLSGGLDFSKEGYAYSVTSRTGHLILSSTLGSVVALSASQDFANSDKGYHIRAVNSHLILSSSAGSIVQVSGGLLLAGTYTSATLPTAPPTGSIVYVSDLGFAAIYVSAAEKYYRLSSGTF